jgi:hypothetical protein
MFKKSNLDSLGLENMADSYKSEIHIRYIAFLALKEKVGKNKLGVFILESQIPSLIWREMMGTFLAMPWCAAKITESDANLLNEMSEMLKL